MESPYGHHVIKEQQTFTWQTMLVVFWLAKPRACLLSCLLLTNMIEMTKVCWVRPRLDCKKNKLDE
jgi:hypothetical protein